MNNVIIFPTDTVYGIGTKISDKEGIDLIYQIKKRPKDKPLAVLCANLKQIEDICYLTNDARVIINKFMPGPLTLILNAKDEIIKMTGLNIITNLSYNDYLKIPPDEIIQNAIYFLKNGMIFSQGKKYGNDIKLVDDFPVSPVQGVVYINKNTLEQKIWINGSWYPINNKPPTTITNAEIEKMFQDDF